MTTDNKNTQEFLFVPITVAVLLILIAAFVVWGTQIGPTTQAAAQAEIPASDASAQEPRPEAEPVFAGDPAAGQELFTGTCAACHGPAGEGIQGLGKDMTTSQFIAGKTDEELIEFIKVGRDPGDPLNTTGIGMPSKGGNPSLTDENLQDIVSYIRSIQK